MSKSLPAIGFLTALEDAQHGYFGGYLVLSEFGRPLEFHCSTPVLPNQAQRILYGKTLGQYVLSDLIGQTLLSKSQLPVQAVLTDLREMLGLTLMREEAIFCVNSSAPADECCADSTIPKINLAGYCLSSSSACISRSREQEVALQSLVSHVDLFEPFDRIREAIREAQRLTDHNPDESYDNANAA